MSSRPNVSRRPARAAAGVRKPLTAREAQLSPRVRG